MIPAPEAEPARIGPPGAAPAPAPGPRRVLVAARRVCASVEAVRSAAALARPGGQVVVAAVVEVPMSEALAGDGADVAPPVADALRAGLEALAGSGVAGSTRLVRARAFARGLMGVLESEAFDVVVVEYRRGELKHGPEGQFFQLWERSPVPIVVVRSD